MQHDAVVSVFVNVLLQVDCNQPARTAISGAETPLFGRVRTVLRGRGDVTTTSLPDHVGSQALSVVAGFTHPRLSRLSDPEGQSGKTARGVYGVGRRLIGYRLNPGGAFEQFLQDDS